MRRILIMHMLLLMLLCSACGQEQAVQQGDVPASPGVSGPAESWSFEGTVFRYRGQDYDVASRVGGINSIVSAFPVGEKIVVECHVGPKNGVYCIFDTVTNSFETDLFGSNLIFSGNDITTAVYTFWSEIHRYDGTVIKAYDLAESEFIRGLEFFDDHTKLRVWIAGADGTVKTDIIDMKTSS